jgi:hypothetical protein
MLKTSARDNRIAEKLLTATGSAEHDKPNKKLAGGANKMGKISIGDDHN